MVGRILVTVPHVILLFFSFLIKARNVYMKVASIKVVLTILRRSRNRGKLQGRAKIA